MPRAVVEHLAFVTVFVTVCLLMPANSVIGSDGHRNRFSVATHSNFLKSQYSGEVKAQIGFCGSDNNFCTDPKKNPGGGSTCCFKKVCRDLANDRNNCGRCGNSCGYGLSCCTGKCVNLFSNNNHCGNCQTACFGKAECDFGLCGYGGYDNNKPDVFPKHW